MSCWEHACHHTVIWCHKSGLNPGSFFSDLTLHLYFCLGANSDPLSLSSPLTEPIHWILQISFLYTSQICPFLIIFLDTALVLDYLHSLQLVLPYIFLPPSQSDCTTARGFFYKYSNLITSFMASNSFPDKPQINIYHARPCTVCLCPPAPWPHLTLLSLHLGSRPGCCLWFLKGQRSPRSPLPGPYKVRNFSYARHVRHFHLSSST